MNNIFYKKLFLSIFCYNMISCSTTNNSNIKNGTDTESHFDSVNMSKYDPNKLIKTTVQITNNVSGEKSNNINNNFEELKLNDRESKNMTKRNSKILLKIKKQELKAMQKQKLLKLKKEEEDIMDNEYYKPRLDRHFVMTNSLNCCKRCIAKAFYNFDELHMLLACCSCRQSCCKNKKYWYQAIKEKYNTSKLQLLRYRALDDIYKLKSIFGVFTNALAGASFAVSSSLYFQVDHMSAIILGSSVWLGLVGFDIACFIRHKFAPSSNYKIINDIIYNQNKGGIHKLNYNQSDAKSTSKCCMCCTRKSTVSLIKNHKNEEETAIINNSNVLENDLTR